MTLSRLWRWGLAFALAMTGAGNALAQGGLAAAGITCPKTHMNAGFLIANLCYPCFFPMRLLGGVVGDLRAIPKGAAFPVCVCPGHFGVPTPGTTLGMWQPTNIIEVVRTPGCLLTAPLSLPVADASSGALLGGHDSPDRGEDSTFYNVHLFAFPLGEALDALVDAVCVANTIGYDIDLLYLSEIDPTWASDTLSLHTTPEAVLFSSPPAIAACIVDAVAASVHQPIDQLFWCAGSFGHLFPYSGQIPHAGSPPRESSLAVAKFMAAMFRRGIMQKTMGNSAVCVNHPFPNLIKGQHKLQMVYPIPERISNHWIGANTFRWGEWRNIPVVGEDFVNVVWTWEECCVNP